MSRRPVKKSSFRAHAIPINEEMRWALFLFITSLFPKTSASGEALVFQDEEARLLYCSRMMSGREIAKLNIDDYENPDLVGRIMIATFFRLKDSINNASNLNSFMRKEVMSAYHINYERELLSNDDFGWEIETLEDGLNGKKILKLYHEGKKTIQTLEVPWDMKIDRQYQILFSTKVRFANPPLTASKRIKNARRAAEKKRDSFAQEQVALWAQSHNQVVRAFRFYSEYLASFLARYGETLIRTNPSIVQRMLLELPVIPERLDLFARGSLSEYSLAAFMRFGFLAWHVNPGVINLFSIKPMKNGAEYETSYDPNVQKNIVVSEDAEMVYFYSLLETQMHPSTYGVSFKINDRSHPVEIVYFRPEILEKQIKHAEDVKRFLEEHPHLVNSRIRQTMDREGDFAPTPRYLNLFDEIVEYVRTGYASDTRGLAINASLQDDLLKLMDAMKRMKGRTEFMVLTDPSLNTETSNKINGTVSVVTSKPGELSPVEDFIPGFRITRTTNKPIVEISRLLMDFSARRTFTAKRLLQLAYYVVSTRDVEKVTAFCSKKLSEDVIREYGFHKVKETTIMGGRVYYLLEATPEEILRQSFKLE